MRKIKKPKALKKMHSTRVIIYAIPVLNKFTMLSCLFRFSALSGDTHMVAPWMFVVLLPIAHVSHATALPVENVSTGHPHK